MVGLNVNEGLVSDAYYKGYKNPNLKDRFEVLDQFGNYDLLDTGLLVKRGERKGGLSFNFSNMTDYVDCEEGREPDFTLRKNNKHISSVYCPLRHLTIGYGDVMSPIDKSKTNDALLFIFSPLFDEVEILVFRGKKGFQKMLFQLLASGGLNQQIEFMRSKATRVA